MVFSVHRPQYFISHTESQRSLLMQQWLSCEKVNLDNTLVMWDWDACEKPNLQTKFIDTESSPFGLKDELCEGLRHM